MMSNSFKYFYRVANAQKYWDGIYQYLFATYTACKQTKISNFSNFLTKMLSQKIRGSTQSYSPKLQGEILRLSI